MRDRLIHINDDEEFNDEYYQDVESYENKDQWCLSDVESSMFIARHRIITEAYTIMMWLMMMMMHPRERMYGS